ncbi:MAG: RDD family protein [Rhabdaerophilum sp.]
MREGAGLVRLSASLQDRFAFSLIDSIIAFSLWFAIAQTTCPSMFVLVWGHNSPPPICNTYEPRVLTLWFGLLGLSVALHRVYGGSIGKLILGFRTVTLEGEKPSWKQAAGRSYILFAIGLLVFRSGSTITIGIGLAAWIALALGLFSATEKDQRSELEKFIGIVTVKKRDLVDFNRAQASE